MWIAARSSSSKHFAQASAHRLNEFGLALRIGFCETSAASFQQPRFLAMKIRLILTTLLLAMLTLLGCATGNQWYYPYGPTYFGRETLIESERLTPDGFISFPRPE